MKEFAKEFYSSGAWKECREAYRRSRQGLCEACLAEGIITAGVIVHHKIHITPETLNDPAVALSPDNLELLCRQHHAERHGNLKRYTVDAAGRISPR